MNVSLVIGIIPTVDDANVMAMLKLVIQEPEFASIVFRIQQVIIVKNVLVAFMGIQFLV